MTEGPAPNAGPSSPAAAASPAPAPEAVPPPVADPPAAPAPEADLAPASVADGVAHSLDPRSVSCDRAVAWIAVAAIGVSLLAALGIVALAASLPSAIAGLLFGGVLAVVAALAWAGHAWPALAHRRASYRVHDRGVEIRRGVWWRAEIQVPRSRIQHTDVSRNPLERRFGLATLHLFTAGTAYSRVSLHGLAEERARQIRDYLIEEIQSDAV